MIPNASWIDRNQKTAAWFVASVSFLLLQQWKGINLYPWDAAQYWNLSTLTALFTTADDLRGYFYPLLLSPARFLSDSIPALRHLPYRVISALVYAYIFAGLLPDFCHSVFRGRLGFWRRLVVPALVAALFPGLIVYPLSDIPALALMLGALVCAIRSTTDDGDRPVRRYSRMVLAGLLTYGAYNTRMIYLFPALLTIPVIAVFIYRGYPLQVRLAALSFFLAGAVIACLPQLLINGETRDKWSPWVIGDDQGESLISEQLLWGIAVQRYETTLDRSAHGPRVFYVDAAGVQLIRSEGITGNSIGLGEYLHLMVRHPLHFLAMFGRHLVNGLDVRDGDVYVRGSLADRHALATVNFLIVFAGIAIMCLAAAARPPVDWRSVEPFFWAFVCLLPALAIIPGSVETRYFFPLHVGIYSAIAFNGNLNLVTGTLRRHALVCFAIFALSAALFFSISTETLSNMQYKYPEITPEGATDTHVEPTLSR